MELSELILRAYPWWEMQRVRAQSLGAQVPDRRLSNEWRHTPGLVDHAHRGVTTPNCDTLYSGAWLDLAGGPILIEVPASDLPYWSIAVMDLNTDNIAIMGSRHPESASLMVCPQHYLGTIPDGVAHVRSASNVVWLLARYLIGNDDLMAKAETMRRGVRLTRFRSGASLSDSAACAPGLPLIQAVRKDPENFWQIVRGILDEDPALPERIGKPIHLEIQSAWPPGVPNWSTLDADFRDRFVEAFNGVLQRITANNSGNIQVRGQWRYPGKDIGNFGANFIYRAEVSLWGLGALPTREAIYLGTLTDESGALLQGAHHYRFRIPPEGIPAEEFWSLTMYEVDPFGGMYFTPNPLNRYAVGDRTRDLKKNADGSIDIWISHEQPVEPNHLANWLPAPAGPFRLMIRAYLPVEDFQSGKIALPAVEKVCIQ